MVPAVMQCGTDSKVVRGEGKDEREVRLSLEMLVRSHGSLWRHRTIQSGGLSLCVSCALLDCVSVICIVCK